MRLWVSGKRKDLDTLPTEVVNSHGGNFANLSTIILMFRRNAKYQGIYINIKPTWRTFADGKICEDRGRCKLLPINTWLREGCYKEWLHERFGTNTDQRQPGIYLQYLLQGAPKMRPLLRNVSHQNRHHVDDHQIVSYCLCTVKGQRPIKLAD